MRRNRTIIRTVAAGASLATGLAVAPVVAMSVLSSAPAAASSGTHKAKLLGNTGRAIEPKVKGKFTCNSVSGVWTLSISGIQVIGSDQVTPWDSTIVMPGHYWLAVTASNQPPGTPSTHFLNTTVALSQDPATGLYGANTGGSMPDPAACATSNFVHVGGGTLTTPDFAASLFIVSNLS